MGSNMAHKDVMKLLAERWAQLKNKPIAKFNPAVAGDPEEGEDAIAMIMAGS